MEAGRERYAEVALPEAVDWAVQNARVVHQYALMEAQQLSRDESMARNVKWILDHAPKGAKIVLWAHNGHVSRGSSFGYQPMGAFLDKWYGKDQVVIGFATGEGQYTAVVRGKGLASDNQLQSPPNGSYEEYFRACGISRFILDLRRAVENDAGSRWLTRPTAFRSIGAVAMDEQFGLPTNLRKQFDALIYLDKTTASRLLPGVWRNRGKN
jgi:erythromycin esterase